MRRKRLPTVREQWIVKCDAAKRSSGDAVGKSLFFLRQQRAKKKAFRTPRRKAFDFKQPAGHPEETDIRMSERFAMAQFVGPRQASMREGVLPRPLEHQPKSALTND